MEWDAGRLGVGDETRAMLRGRDVGLSNERLEIVAWIVDRHVEDEELDLR
jgi:hypothetical protein